MARRRRRLKINNMDHALNIPSKAEVILTAKELLQMSIDDAEPLPSNGPDRHWNWRIRTGELSFLIRIENPVAAAQRNTYIKDEISIIKFFSTHGIAPTLIANDPIGGKVLVTEWIDAPQLPPQLTDDQLKKLVKFLARVNAIPYTASAQRLQLTELFFDIRHLKKMVQDRLDMAKHMPEFQEAIFELRPVLDRGFEKLEDDISQIPQEIIYKPLLCYRDVGSTNFLETEPDYIAVDWEYHSVCVADPSFSLAILSRRFQLSSAQESFALQEYKKFADVPYLEALIKARTLERILVDESTWNLEWAIRRQTLPLENKEKAKAGAILQMQKKAKELISLIEK
jgi:hypothetical protein